MDWDIVPNLPAGAHRVLFQAHLGGNAQDTTQTSEELAPAGGKMTVELFLPASVSTATATHISNSNVTSMAESRKGSATSLA